MVAGPEKAYYCLRAVGLQAWEIPNERWETIAAEARSEAPLTLGSPAGDLLMHCDAQQAGYLPLRKATFLFITRDATPGILRLVSQVSETGTPDRFWPLHLRKAPDNRPDQKEDEWGFHNGVKIEYKFFYQEMDAK